MVNVVHDKLNACEYADISGVEHDGFIIPPTYIKIEKRFRNNTKITKLEVNNVVKLARKVQCRYLIKIRSEGNCC